MTPQPVSLRRTGTDAGWDAIVVGARVAGASTALLLARAGLRVLVVDRARRGSDTLSTHALMRGGVVHLKRWGLLDGVAATGAPPVRRVTFHYGREHLPVSLKPYAGVDALYAPRRTILDALLVEAAEEAGARFRFGPVVTDLARDGAGRVVGVVVRDRSRSHLDRARTGSSSAPTAATRWWPRGWRHRSSRRVAPAPRMPTGTGRRETWTATTGSTAGTTAEDHRRIRRGHPDERRPGVRVRRRPAGRAGCGGAPPRARRARCAS